MELRHLRYFVAVAEAGSLKLAAEAKLHTTQPSLSRQIHDLEHEVGTPLFLRSARGVQLTAAGRLLLEHARVVLLQAETAVNSVRQIANSTKPAFTLGFMIGHDSTWIPKSLAVLRNDLPKIHVVISTPEFASACSGTLPGVDRCRFSSPGRWRSRAEVSSSYRGASQGFSAQGSSPGQKNRHQLTGSRGRNFS